MSHNDRFKATDVDESLTLEALEAEDVLPEFSVQGVSSATRDKHRIVQLVEGQETFARQPVPSMDTISIMGYIPSKTFMSCNSNFFRFNEVLWKLKNCHRDNRQVRAVYIGPRNWIVLRFEVHKILGLHPSYSMDELDPAGLVDALDSWLQEYGLQAGHPDGLIQSTINWSVIGVDFFRDFQLLENTANQVLQSVHALRPPAGGWDLTPGKTPEVVRSRKLGKDHSGVSLYFSDKEGDSILRCEARWRGSQKMAKALKEAEMREPERRDKRRFGAFLKDENSHISLYNTMLSRKKVPYGVPVVPGKSDALRMRIRRLKGVHDNTKRKLLELARSTRSTDGSGESAKAHRYLFKIFEQKLQCLPASGVEYGQPIHLAELYVK